MDVSWVRSVVTILKSKFFLCRLLNHRLANYVWTLSPVNLRLQAIITGIYGLRSLDAICACSNWRVEKASLLGTSVNGHQIYSRARNTCKYPT
jgi:hypothetical protein